MKKTELVSIVVLTYNSKDHLLDCIHSIENQNYDNIEMIIVDNFSNDGTRQLLANLKIDKSIKVKIILNSSNLGYNKGNKIGIENSDGAFILILNPDVILEKLWVTNTMNMFKINKDFAMISGRLTDVKKEIVSEGGMLDIYGATSQLVKNLHKDKKMFYCPGAAFIFKRKILSQVRFDPNLFMYYDDVDLAWQARLLGLKIGYCNTASAVHKEGQSLPGIPPRKFYHIMKNRIYVCSKNYSLNRVIKRVFKIIFLSLIGSIYYSFTFKSSKYFLVTLKALIWNIQNMSNLRLERAKIQNIRVLSDEEIEHYMDKKSIELNTIRQNLRRKR